MRLQEDIHKWAKGKGWWDKERSIPELLCLIHSEISEALEEYRNSKMNVYFKDKKPEGFPIELADTVIRILDLAEFLEIDIMEMIKIKMKYNETRLHRHGGKKC